MKPRQRLEAAAVVAFLIIPLAIYLIKELTK